MPVFTCRCGCAHVWLCGCGGDLCASVFMHWCGRGDMRCTFTDSSIEGFSKPDVRYPLRSTRIRSTMPSVYHTPQIPHTLAPNKRGMGKGYTTGHVLDICVCPIPCVGVRVSVQMCGWAGVWPSVSTCVLCTGACVNIRCTFIDASTGGVL